MIYNSIAKRMEYRSIYGCGISGKILFENTKIKYFFRCPITDNGLVLVSRSLYKRKKSNLKAKNKLNLIFDNVKNQIIVQL